jgi:hypothetical protein
MGKKIYIYFGAYGHEYCDGAVAELSCKANGKVYALVSSSSIDEVWCNFQKRIASHGIKGNSSILLISDLALTLFSDIQVPFRCLRRLNDTKWACTERCIVGDETAKELML